jgi:plastocyanin
MRVHGLTIGLSVVVAAGLAACSGTTAPTSSGGAPPGGGASATITANYNPSGSYGSTGANAWYFSPVPDTVAAGTPVTFQWSGGAQHNIHFDAVPAPVDSVPTSNSGSASRTFTTPGTYSYHCTIHPMSGVIVVH